MASRQETIKQRRETIKQKTVEWLAAREGGAVTPEEFSGLRERLGRVSEDYLRRLLRESGVSLHPLVEGVRQHTLEELERTLLQLSEQYGEARKTGDAARAKLCRRLVVTAKNHAKLALRRASEQAERQRREETLLWLFTWLENPEVFAEWLPVRKKQSSRRQPQGAAS